MPEEDEDELEDVGLLDEEDELELVEEELDELEVLEEVEEELELLEELEDELLDEELDEESPFDELEEELAEEDTGVLLEVLSVELVPFVEKEASSEPLWVSVE